MNLGTDMSIYATEEWRQEGKKKRECRRRSKMMIGDRMLQQRITVRAYYKEHDRGE